MTLNRFRAYAQDCLSRRFSGWVACPCDAKQFRVQLDRSGFDRHGWMPEKRPDGRRRLPPLQGVPRLTEHVLWGDAPTDDLDRALAHDRSESTSASEAWDWVPGSVYARFTDRLRICNKTDVGDVLEGAIGEVEEFLGGRRDSFVELWVRGVTASEKFVLPGQPSIEIVSGEEVEDCGIEDHPDLMFNHSFSGEMTSADGKRLLRRVCELLRLVALTPAAVLREKRMGRRRARHPTTRERRVARQGGTRGRLASCGRTYAPRCREPRVAASAPRHVVLESLRSGVRGAR